MSATSDKKIVINKRLKGLPREALEKLSQTELIDKIVQLEAYNFQLRNLLQKKLTEQDKNDEEYAILFGKEAEDKVSKDKKVPSKAQKQRKFDWSSAHRRHVLLKITYFGWDYQGFACQEDSNDTIESNLFRALTRTCLIESRATSNYHRCGRTDKEVSAFCQVISIDLRSKHPPETQLDPSALISEIDYCGLLNRVLPKNIQCVAWMPLRSPVYSARFDCVSRSYRYYFPKGDLDISAMQEACRLLVRHADFRNFCKMDVHNGVTNYMRNLQSARVQACEENQSKTGYDMYYLEIQANAFLWHQIRCIMAVLLLVGQRKEQPNVISHLLDVDSNPCKPQYTPAIGLPLNLFRCDFRDKTTRSISHPSNEDANEEAMDTATEGTQPSDAPACSEERDLTSWIYSEENLQKLIENTQCEWTQFSVKSTMIRNVLQQLENLLEDNFKPKEKVQAQVILLQDSVKPRQYQPLLERKRCESLENRIDHFVKKQRLIVKDETETA
ncbi:tRNA pseudouridine(38/39) synthase [Drosophila biarmipes]|uniref:tRNA pseudouridine(38/39) synthase n=1 Tax=Drosophila biarmipes TaxID=125945 RepID=UPI0007E82C16|nr:tRNA pseudouridine(38/39) synthase [Drosophila biarmipes]XP_050743331.1 tRNA pseudouridine(38/39) synthase [Drosophila biarmipes]